MDVDVDVDVDADADADADADVDVGVPSSIEERGDIERDDKIEDGIKLESPWKSPSSW